MTHVDTSFYNALGARPRSMGEYAAELDAADIRKQAMQQNALALQVEQQKADEYARSVQDNNALRDTVRGFGADPRQNLMSLYGAGRLSEAQAYQKAIDESQKSAVEAEKTRLANGLQRFEIIGQAMSGVKDQATYDIARQQVAQYFGPDEASKIDPIYNPQVIEQNKAKAMPVKAQMELRLRELDSQSQNANRDLVPNGQGGWKVNAPLVGAKSQIAQSGAPITYGSPTAMLLPGSNEPVMVQPGNRPGAAPQIMRTPSGPLRPIADKSAGKPPPGYRFTPEGDLEAIPGGPADAKAQAAAQLKAGGAAEVDSSIATLRDAYDRLEKGGGVTSTNKGPIDNLRASSSSSTVGQALGRAFGTSNQSARNDIAMARPALLAALMKATGMSSKQLDSNAELKLWLTTATDPTLDVESNRRALANIERKYLGQSQSSNQSSVGTPADIGDLLKKYGK